MIELEGDFWEETNREYYDAICCTTNQVVKQDGCLAVGGGIALDFALRYKNLPYIWGQQLLKGHHSRGFMVTEAFMVELDDNYYYLVAFPTKNHFVYPSEMPIIEHSLRALVWTADVFGWQNVLLTRPGCGLGGLNWKDKVKPIVECYLDERFTVINK